MSRLRIAGLAAVVLAVALVLFLPRLEQTIQEVTLPLRHEDVIRQQAREKGVDASLIAAVIYAESKFRDQTSNAGARGLMQITPATADTIEKLSGGNTFVYDDLANPELNIRYGTFYLRYLLDRYRGNVAAALAAYNAGPGKADAWGGAQMSVGAIDIAETRSYVAKVLEKRHEYARTYRRELGLSRRG
ncbi:MAG: soluble lytic murein transglycosylase [Solirubrobacterales bacterium]|nr:soluble lytic murein transglycosylase [Solirubrobacterales bacterium]